jgi:hypothetical protein
MYNIDLYNYSKDPYSRDKKFSIHPLNEPGKEKYYSDQSHCKHYLKRTDPFVFKSILGVDYDTLIHQQRNDIDQLNSINQKITPIPNEDNKINENEYPKENQLEENKVNELNNENNNKFETVGDYNNYNRNINSMRNLGNHKSMSSSILRPYRKQRTFKDIYGYDNITSFKSNGEKYLYSINNMKRNNAILKVPLAQKRYDGFTVFDAPVIEKNKLPSSLFQSYNDKMGHTLNCIKNSEGVRKAMNEDEMRSNLFNQTSKQFLKQYHLPDILKIAESKQVIRKQKIGLSKEMGEKYNPYSLIVPSKNRTGRNYIGDLFKH